MMICLCRHYLVIVEKHRQHFTITYHAVAPLVEWLQSEKAGANSEERPECLLEAPVSRFQSRPVPDFPDFNIAADDSQEDLPTVTLLAFNSQAAFQNRNNMVNLFYFSPSLAATQDVQVHELRFAQPTSAVQELVCLGKSGRRAVWIQRLWATDVFELMKGSFTQRKVAVVDLFASRLALPFTISAVQTVTFDEASGRVGLGLLTGEVYLFQF